MLSRGLQSHFLKDRKGIYSFQRAIQSFLQLVLNNGTRSIKNDVYRSFFRKLTGSSSTERLLGSACTCYCRQGSFLSNDVVTWSGYHGSLKRTMPMSPVISALLRLFYDKASMVKHGMEMQLKATAYLNPG